MSTINKPLPHRPFSLAGDLDKAPKRHPQPQMTAVSTLRPYVPANGRQLTAPGGAPGRVPKRAHLVTRSPSPPSPPYYHAAASDALPSSKPKPSHSFSESQSRQSRSVPHSSTADLVPLHLKATRSTSFWRRHWNRIARLCHQFDSHNKRVTHQECAWGSPAFYRAH